jgi:hypothetical protein
VAVVGNVVDAARAPVPFVDFEIRQRLADDKTPVLSTSWVEGAGLGVGLDPLRLPDRAGRHGSAGDLS